MSLYRHSGEQMVQRRAGEGHDGWGSPMFGAEISPAFAKFLGRQHMLIIGAPADDGHVWSTILAGEIGFAVATDERTILIDALPAEGDPLRHAFEEPRDFGILVIDLVKRRRIRINGRAQRCGEGLAVRTEQVLGNCPKYIQTRELLDPEIERLESKWHTGLELNSAQVEWVSRSDTFFIASRASEYGADASHRGGQVGFVNVHNSRQLSWPDYIGNSFYMTLGNLMLEPSCGLLFVDWEQGHTLHMAGQGRVDWDEERAKSHPGALRMVEFDIEQVVQVDNAIPLRWKFDAYSPFCPPAA